MTKKNKPNYGRAIAFIENSYVFTGQLEQEWRISWDRLLNDFLLPDFDIWITRFYASRKIDDSRQLNFFRALARLGYTLITNEYQARDFEVRDPEDDSRTITKTVYTEKGLDVHLATDLLTLLKEDAYDTVVFFSGDSVYAPALRAVEASGKRVVIVGWRESISHRLLEIATDPVIFLDDIRDLIEKEDETDI